MEKIKKQKEIIQLNTFNINNDCFGRISENVFNNLKSLDDLIIKMRTTKNGNIVSSIEEPNIFKSRLKHFKQFLKKELPEFSEQEILKFDKYFYKLKKIYEWRDIEYFLAVIEYEIRNKIK